MGVGGPQKLAAGVKKRAASPPLYACILLSSWLSVSEICCCLVRGCRGLSVSSSSTSPHSLLYRPGEGGLQCERAPWCGKKQITVPLLSSGLSTS